jgi:hypothetical protein
MTGHVYDSTGQRWKQPKIYKYSTARAAWELTGQASYPGLQVESMFEPYLGAGTVWQRPMATEAIMPTSAFSSVLANWMWTYALTPYSTPTGTPSGATGDKTLFSANQRAVYVTDSTDPRCRYQQFDTVTATGVPTAEINAILKTVPWPSGFNPVNGNISLYDVGTGIMREYTGVAAVANNPGHWTASGAGFSVANPFFKNLPTTNYATQVLHGIGTTTLMHPTLGYVGISEIRAGEINHALAFNMSNATANRPASWPAAATDGRFPSETWAGWNNNYPGDSPRLGQWGRLPLTVNPQYNPRNGLWPGGGGDHPGCAHLHR